MKQVSCNARALQLHKLMIMHVYWRREGGNYMRTVGENKFLSNEKRKKIDKKKFETNRRIPINSLILVKNRQLAIVVKMHTDHEEKKYYPSINQQFFKIFNILL